MTSYVSGNYSILSLLKQKQVLIGILVLFYWPEIFPASIMYLSLSLFSMFRRYFRFCSLFGDIGASGPECSLILEEFLAWADHSGECVDKSKGCVEINSFSSRTVNFGTKEYKGSDNVCSLYMQFWICCILISFCYLVTIWIMNLF